MLVVACWYWSVSKRLSSSWCYVCVTVFLSSLQSHDVLWWSEIWKENVVSSKWGWSPQPSQVHAHKQTRLFSTGPLNIVDQTLFCCVSYSVLLSCYHSHTNLQWNFLFSTAIVPTTASVLAGNLRASWIVVWSFLSLSHSYEKRLFWGEARRSDCSRRILPIDTLCKHTTCQAPCILTTCTNKNLQ